MPRILLHEMMTPSGRPSEGRMGSAWEITLGEYRGPDSYSSQPQIFTFLILLASKPFRALKPIQLEFLLLES